MKYDHIILKMCEEAEKYGNFSDETMSKAAVILDFSNIGLCELNNEIFERLLFAVRMVNISVDVCPRPKKLYCYVIPHKDMSETREKVKTVY